MAFADTVGCIRVGSYQPSEPSQFLKDGDSTASEGHRVYADPAGHPFCIGWGHPDNDAVRVFLRDHSE